MTLSRGIDVSHHQGVVDWRRLKTAHGLTWGACKATEGAGFTDAQFTRNWANLKAAGLVRVAYHFGRPGSSATAQARRFLDVVKPVKGDVLCLDLEQSDGRSQAQVNSWAKAFGKYLRDHSDCTTWVYLGGYAGNGTGRGLSAFFDYWWYPRYATMSAVSHWPASSAPRLSGNTTGWAAPHIWQWACSLRTAEGLVDANVSPLPAAVLRDGPAAPVKPIPKPPAPKPVPGGTTPTPGSDTVPTTLHASWTGRLDLTSGAWRTVNLQTIKGAGTPSVLAGPAAFSGDVKVYLTGGTPGQTVQVRAVLCELTAGTWQPVRSLGITEHQLTSGTSFLQRTLTGRASAGQRLRLLVAAPTGVAVTGTTTDLLTWKG